ncbi:MAG TPA: hydroxyacylglutathione hydrolase [Nitrosomonas sp.]|jgi:hydroxyacylglutathione hydrolase|nr:hydroxyacylglutathione hydrolase [Nitrosomonas sp.]MBP6354582.1 hydroxyacylglutathione hydrolase [Nitrosomonas sp.]MBP9870826.1 hydroxyacylglutathione hydrolase [Nitrosomonas sp.]MDO8333905.1 hydroxyacylglutathione hydrolase [Nitrosomonas sp.]HQV88774.1 hydroxyacylglutathione hydrolase [Nitrosomonas sp.]
MQNIYPIHAFKDNYIWIIHNNNHAIVVDPGIASPVIEYLHTNKLQLSAILITHHHNDHTGGNAELLKLFDAPVYGPMHELISTVTHPVREGDQINLQAMSLDFTVLEIPGHTRGHIAYYGSNPIKRLFCGDTLFACGCGRVFEGTVQQMYHSLGKLSRLPDDTLVYCAHEYTLNNIHFARTVDPDNPKLAELEVTMQALRCQNIPTIPTTLALEKTVNPFLRCDQPEIMDSVQNYTDKILLTPLDIFTELRNWKNNF